MLWRELQQRGDEAFQKSNKRWPVLGVRAKEHDSRMGFWRVCLDIRKIQVQRHQHANGRAATLREHRIPRTREILTGDRIRSGACTSEERYLLICNFIVDSELMALLASGTS